MVNDLRNCVDGDFSCEDCEHVDTVDCEMQLLQNAADAIEELFQAINERPDRQGKPVLG